MRTMRETDEVADARDGETRLCRAVELIRSPRA